MLLLLVILKSLIELALAFIVGRLVLGVLIGNRRDGNLVWQLLDIAAKPALWLTRRLSPKIVLDRHIPQVAMLWLGLAWLIVLTLKVDACIDVGVSNCL